MLSPEVLDGLPTAPDKLAKQVIVDNEWYAKNMIAIQERFDRLRSN